MMDILKDVCAELFSMFVTDIRLTLFTLILVGVVAVLIFEFNVNPLYAGGLLLLGCIAIVVEAALREARLRMATRK